MGYPRKKSSRNTYRGPMSQVNMFFRIFFEIFLKLTDWAFRNIVQLLILILLVFHIQFDIKEHNVLHDSGVSQHEAFQEKNTFQHQHADNRLVEHHNFLHNLIEEIKRRI